MKLGVQQRKRGMSTEDADVKARELKDTLFRDDDGKRSSRLMPMRGLKVPNEQSEEPEHT